MRHCDIVLIRGASHLGDTVGKHGLPRTLTSPEARELWGKEPGTRPFFFVSGFPNLTKTVELSGGPRLDRHRRGFSGRTGSSTIGVEG